ncbi:MAG: glycosyltransferase [Alphaproteobacteria bacterium]|nr:glycosyltransferase [Alphaproteobacteria bacterium]
MTIWMDLTNSLITNQGNVVGIIRAELMLAKYLHALDPSIRFSVTMKQGFKEVSIRSLNWLWKSKNINDDYIRFQKKRRGIISKLFAKIDYKLYKASYRRQRHHRPNGMPKKEFIIWPYKDGDVVFSCGWLGTARESHFGKVKTALPNLKLVYTVYDLAILQSSLKSLYTYLFSAFSGYLQWINKNCDAIIYGGKTAQKDTENYFKENNLDIPAGYPVKWGNDIKSETNSDMVDLSALGIKKPFILSVGSFDGKKNYQLLYQTYCAAQFKGIDLPQLVIVGRLVQGHDLYSMFQTNPYTKEKVKILSVKDEELTALYKNCLFTVLPTLYEGWSLTLPESFYYGKMCVCSDVAPLREVGENFACYVNPYHPAEWVETITDLAKHPEKVKKYEQKIAQKWHSVSWQEAAENVYQGLLKTSRMVKINSTKLYYDLGLLHYTLSGIPRTQLLLARRLYQIRKDIEFFYMNKGEYYYLPPEMLPNLLSEENIDSAVAQDKATARGIKQEKLPFTSDSIVLAIGVGYDSKSQECLMQAKQKIGFKIVSTIFDFTPLTVPQTHPQDRVWFYPIFLKNLYALSDYMVYGGKTAQKDGEKFQKENDLPIIPSLAVKWGNDIVAKKHSKKEMDQILKRCGVNGDYILTVGTIEARKNHQILYDAYLELLRDKSMKNKMPQLFICGHPGWKTNDFQQQLRQDERVKGKIIMFSPTDEELDILYQNCKFTCLASLYEGWSLTLPESLNYGKFCLTTDTPSLKETGEDIVDYANPYDPVEWATKIKYYLTDKSALKKREALIKKKWHNTTWLDCAKNISHFIDKLNKQEKRK